LAAFVRLPSGSWRAVVRRKRRYISETFKRKEDARSWALEAERQIDQGGPPTPSRVKGMKTFGQLIELHIADMKEVGRAPGRTKSATLAMLKRELGQRPMTDMNRERLIKFGRDRAAQRAGPVTVSMDIGAIKLVISHAAAVHGLRVSMEQVDLARIALKRLGLVGNSNERSRRPTQEELRKLFDHFDGIRRLSIPMSRVVRFAIATAMRQEEIFRVTWEDYDRRTKMLLIRDRKDPREKKGNHQRIPLLDISGWDAVALIEEQRAVRSNADDRIFPHNHRSAGTAFTRACGSLGIVDLHFHDLRHDGTSRLFEAEFKIQQAALVTGHKDWKMLARYTHLRPESLHEFVARRRPPTDGDD
jgi:integrase